MTEQQNLTLTKLMEILDQVYQSYGDLEIRMIGPEFALTSIGQICVGGDPNNPDKKYALISAQVLPLDKKIKLLSDHDL